MNNNQSESRIEVSDCSDLTIENHNQQEEQDNTNFHKIPKIQIPNLIVSDSASSSCGSSAKNFNANLLSYAPNFLHDERIKSSSVHDLRRHSVNYNLLNVECVGVSPFCPT